MPHSKTPGQSNAASDKFLKKDAEGTMSPASLVPSHFSYSAHLILALHGHCEYVIDTFTAHGTGAPNAPAHKEQPAPGERPVASDSGNSNVGVDPSANQRGEKGIGGPTFSAK